MPIRNSKSFDLQRIIESKCAHRRQLAALPIGEKLRLLDELRERALALRKAGNASHHGIQEDGGRYHTPKS